MPLLSATAGAPFRGRSAVRQAAYKLAVKVAETRAALASGPVDDTWLSLSLSKMFREAYLDLPSLSFSLLLLATHDASISLAEELPYDVARLTQGVFAPLAEMLGIWALYRKWIEKVYAALEYQPYKEMERLLGDPNSYTEAAFKGLIAAREGTREAASPPKSNNLSDKAEAFLCIKSRLEKAFALKGITATVKLLKLYPGLALTRVGESESKEDVASRLRVRVLCASVDDCYAVLGAIHGLGKPVSFRSALYFNDHIASPQPNGYRALHTAITFRDFRAGGGGSIVIECRVITLEMYELNERGAVAALLREPRSAGSPHEWWNQLPELTRQLHKNADGEDVAIQQHLADNNIGSEPETLYVFTPRGEIVLLPQGSTPLDFAYRIHTEMGHHAIRLDVNGKAVPHGYPLRSGDVVRIHYDPDYAGPDMSWLGLVATRHARVNIRRKLSWRARVAHQGRAYVEEALLKAIERFKLEKQYDLNVTTDRVERFLRESSQAHGYSSVNELYEALLDGSGDGGTDGRLTQILVGQLISAELSSLVRSKGGGPLPYLPHQVRICRQCLPVPGDTIVGCETRAKSGEKGLIIHRARRRARGRLSPHHAGSAGAADDVQIEWAGDAESDQKELLVFRISASDRLKLLREVLETVYDTDEAYLYKVEAQTYGDRQAEISLVVRADTFDRFTEIQARLSRVAGVHAIVTAPPSPSQRSTFSADPLHFQPPRQSPPPLPNPYTSEEVFERGIFYDREHLLDAISRWLRTTAPADPMILHGQRRVGKTSLVRYLVSQYLPPFRFVHPVFIDLQALSEFSPLNVAGLIVKRVFRSLGQNAPDREVGEEPMEWLSRSLDKARQEHSRLLLIIDEFNVLIDVERDGKTDGVIYTNLRAVMNEQRYVNWLLVVQDTHFFAPDMWRGAGILLQKSLKLAVEHLGPEWARRLILEPARKCGVVPDDEDYVINEVLRLTAGSPFLIQLICRELVERARLQGRRAITAADVDAAAGEITHNGERYFFHFTQNLTGLREVVMAAVAEALIKEESVGEEEVVELVQAWAEEASEKTIKQILVALAKEGLLSLTPGEPRGERRVSIPIGLFKTFVSGRSDLDKSVKEWRASFASRTKAAHVESAL
jgi:(p)ppGpp synthase/HD superfamily hydrolase